MNTRLYSLKIINIGENYNTEFMALFLKLTCIRSKSYVSGETLKSFLLNYT